MQDARGVITTFVMEDGVKMFIVIFTRDVSALHVAEIFSEPFCFLGCSCAVSHRPGEC